MEIAMRILDISSKKTKLSARDQMVLNEIGLTLNQYHLSTNKDLEDACKFWVAMHNIKIKRKPGN